MAGLRRLPPSYRPVLGLSGAVDLRSQNFGKWPRMEKGQKLACTTQSKQTKAKLGQNAITHGTSRMDLFIRPPGPWNRPTRCGSIEYLPQHATVTLHCLKPRHVDRLHMLHEPDDPDVMRACTAPIDQMRWTCCMRSYDTVPVLNGLVHGCIRSRSIEHPIMHTYTQTRMQTHKHFKNF